MDLSQYFPPMTGGKARPKTGFWLNLQKRLVLESSGCFLAKRLTWRVGWRLFKVVESLVVVVSLPVLLIQGRRGAMGVDAPAVLQSIASSSSSFIVQVGTLPEFLDQWRIIPSNGFVLNMVKGYHLQLRSHPPLFLNFKPFNIKVSAAHHLIIQKEVDDLLAKG